MRISGKPIPIVVFMCDRDVFHHGALSIARSAGRLGIPVHGVHQDGLAPGALSRYNRGRIVCRSELSAEQWLEGLIRLGRKLGEAVLVPMDDAGALLVNEHTDELAEHYLFPRQPPGLVRSLSSKHSMHETCERLGVPVPKAVIPRFAEELGRCIDEVGYPVVLKRIEAWQPALDPGPSVLIARDRRELEKGFDRMRSPEGSNVMLQEYIPGGSDSVWMLNGYFDERSECLVALTGRKLRQRGPNTGATTLGVCEPNEQVSLTTGRLMKALGYRGILDIGYRYDARDGRYKLLDVNPRIGATFRLFVDVSGIDVLRALYLDMTGRPVRAIAPRNRRRWVDEPSDLITSLQLRRRGELSAGSWARSFRHVEETAWFARDDPVPAVSVWLRFAGGIARRLTRGGARGHSRGDRRQSPVDEYFEEQSGDWAEIYDRDDVYARIHQERLVRSLDWIDRLGLPAGTPVLELGCGAGQAAVALARRGFRVRATDPVQAMVERTRRHADGAGVGERVEVGIADAHALIVSDESFPLVLALGVVPWLHSPKAALAEIARVLEPGGHVVLSADNAERLSDLIDPSENPSLTRARRVVGSLLSRLGLREPRVSSAKAQRNSRAELDAMLAAAGLERLRGETFGFGPFTLFGRELLPAALGVRVQERLTSWSRRGSGGHLDARGAQYLVVARRPRERRRR